MINVAEPQVRFDVVAEGPDGDSGTDGEEGPLVRPERKRGWSSSTEGEGEGEADAFWEGDGDFQSDSRYTSSYVTDNTDSLTGTLDNVVRNES